MSVNSYDPRPQARIKTRVSANDTAFVGPYVDTSLTKIEIDQTAAEVAPIKPGVLETGSDIRRYYAEDKVSEIDTTAPAENESVVAPEHEKPHWTIETIDGIDRSSDPYANNGIHGREYLRHQN